MITPRGQRVLGVLTASTVCAIGGAGLVLADHLGESRRCSTLIAQHSPAAETYGCTPKTTAGVATVGEGAAPPVVTPSPAALAVRRVKVASRSRLRTRTPETGTRLNWTALAQCESGGNPTAVNPSGKYRGAFQFDRSTWASYGPAGDPAAASYSEQLRRARLLYAARGRSPWPVCGSRL